MHSRKRILWTLSLALASLAAGGLSIYLVGPDVVLCDALLSDALREPLALAASAASRGSTMVHSGPAHQVVPLATLPARCRQRSNNNLDVVRHRGRVYLAWRSAPDHFASPHTSICVASSRDETRWRFERSFSLGTDLREPRFLSTDRALLLYVSTLGADRGAFEPSGVAVAELRDARWKPLLRVAELRGLIAWRVRWVERAGRKLAYMSAYRGGENIYRFNGKPLEVLLLTSRDGRHWQGTHAPEHAVYRGGGSEMDFTFGRSGRLFAVIRNEAGDRNNGTGKLRWGSKICSAPAGRPLAWRCRDDPRKFDSPLMFRHRGKPYLIARRNLTHSGRFDLRDEQNPSTPLAWLGNRIVSWIKGYYGRLDVPLNGLVYHLDYWTTPKRCSVWAVDRESLEISLLADLPSRGDTCFPSLVREADDRYTVYNYSSPLDGPDLGWHIAQLEPTHIYRSSLEFLPPAHAALRQRRHAVASFTSRRAGRAAEAHR